MHCTLPRKQKRSERHRTLRPTGGGLGLVSDSGIFSGIVCYCGILRHNVRYSAYCGITCTISHFPVQFPLAATRSISFRDSTDLISHFPVQFPLTATRSSHFPFAVRLDRSHFATRPISFPISHFSAISPGRDSIRSSISFPNP